MNICNITHVTLSSKPPVNHCMTAPFHYERRFMSIEMLFFVEVHVPNQKSERSCIYLSDVLVASRILIG